MAAWRPRSSGEPTGVGALQSGSTYLFSRAAVTRVAFRVSPKMRAVTPKGCLEAYVNLVIGMVAMFNRPVKRVSYFLDAIPAIGRVGEADRGAVASRVSLASMVQAYQEIYREFIRTRERGRVHG